MNLHSKIKILSILLLAYFFSSFLSKNVFLGNTPEIRKDIALYFLKELESRSSVFTRRIRNQNFDKNVNNNLSAKRYDTVENKEIGVPVVKNRVIYFSKSVYAEVKNNAIEIKIDDKGVEWIERVYELDGRVVTIKIPRDSLPPSEEFIKKFFSE